MTERSTTTDSGATAAAGALALATASVVAALDLVLALRASADTRLATLLAPILVTFGAALVVYALLWFALGRPLARRGNVGAPACAWGIAASVLTALVCVLALQRMQLDIDAKVIAACSLIGLGAGAVLVYLLAPRAQASAFGKLTVFGGLAIAVLAALGATGLWMRSGGRVSPFHAHSASGNDADSDSSQGTPGVKRVVLLVIDTLRADAVSGADPSASSGAPATPALAALAADSVVFDQARSAAPWTLPAMCSMMTGLAPSVHLATTEESVLPDPAVTLAERLRAQGYRTAAIGRNAFLHPRSRLNRGFDEYTMYPRLPEGTPIGSALIETVRARAIPDEPDAEHLTDLACDWLEEHREEPFFLWLHYFDPHWPYVPARDFRPEGEPPRRLGYTFRVPIKDVRTGHFTPDPSERDWIRALYDAEVRYTDHHVQRFLDKLKDLGLYEDTLIVFTSDHGEELWEHDSFEHGHSAYDELLHVPLMFKLPGGAQAGRIEQPVSTASIVPTVLDLIGLERDPQRYSAPPVVGENAQLDGVVAASGLLAHENRTALIAGTRKYIRRALTDREEVFDLAADPGEQASRVLLDDADLERWRLRLKEHLDRSEATRKLLGILVPQVAGLGEASENELRQLGYID